MYQEATLAFIKSRRYFELADSKDLQFFYEWLLTIDRAFEYIHALELSNYDPTLPETELFRLISVCTNLKILTLKTPSLPDSTGSETASWPSKYIASLKNVDRFQFLSHLKQLHRFEWVQPVGLFELYPMQVSAEMRIQELLRAKVGVSVEPLKGVGVFRAYGGFTRYLEMWHTILTKVKMESGEELDV
jgi:hypothetical protein